MASKTTNISIRMEVELKTRAEELFAELGMNISTAFNIFVRQALREGKIPFEISLAPLPAQENVAPAAESANNPIGAPVTSPKPEARKPPVSTPTVSTPAASTPAVPPRTASSRQSAAARLAPSRAITPRRETPARDPAAINPTATITPTTTITPAPAHGRAANDSAPVIDLSSVLTLTTPVDAAGQISLSSEDITAHAPGSGQKKAPENSSPAPNIMDMF